MSQAARVSMSWSRKDVAVAAILAAGCVAVFARACWNDFVNYDDFAYITENPNVRRADGEGHPMGADVE